MKTESMELHLGVKLVRAKEMTNIEYSTLRGVTTTASPAAGYLVEYVGAGDANHTDYDNYISWSPAKTFNASYKPVDGMSFGLAVEAMKLGYIVGRGCWEGIALSMVEAVVFEGGGVRTSCDQEEYIAMAQDGRVIPWVAGHNDILADDWVTLKGEQRWQHNQQ